MASEIMIMGPIAADDTLCCCALPLPALVERELAGVNGTIHWKLSAETSKSRQVTLTKSRVPPSHKINSIRPGRNSHQRVRSSGLNLAACCRCLRLAGRTINCADGEPLAEPAVQELGAPCAGATRGTVCGAGMRARCARPCPGGSVSTSSTLGKRRVVLPCACGWGWVGVSDVNRESTGRLPAASKSGDSYCQMGDDAACGSGVGRLAICSGITC